MNGEVKCNQGVLISSASMTASIPSSDYPLGSTDAEHQRLIRQAEWVNPHTERCFREAGIGLGQRVLDLGSGVGDVALLLARLVGPTGEVIGVEPNCGSEAAQCDLRAVRRLSSLCRQAF
jgi:predicted methyltransferase